MLFARLAVFAGGCSYEAAEEIADADPDTLQSLLDKSLLRKRESRSVPRYWMLETIREYAAEQLAATGDPQRVWRSPSCLLPAAGRGGRAGVDWARISVNGSSCSLSSRRTCAKR